MHYQPTPSRKIGIIDHSNDGKKTNNLWAHSLNNITTSSRSKISQLQCRFKHAHQTKKPIWHTDLLLYYQVISNKLMTPKKFKTKNSSIKKSKRQNYDHHHHQHGDLRIKKQIFFTWVSNSEFAERRKERKRRGDSLTHMAKEAETKNGKMGMATFEWHLWRVPLSSLNRLQKEGGSGSAGGSSTGSADSSSHLLDMDEEPPWWRRTWAIDPDGISPCFPFTFFDLHLPPTTHGLSASVIEKQTGIALQIWKLYISHKTKHTDERMAVRCSLNSIQWSI